SVENSMITQSPCLSHVRDPSPAPGLTICRSVLRSRDAAIELPDDLVEQQRAANEEHVKLLELQERFTHPEGAETSVPARD
ncbi:hypothetical protein ABZS88_46840, partial [Streptomyces sp. NPDC005480]|uniref:hypothetical protein n=1 Tax=Streptomyces sp. NPDC005480 TaxID=3154880 RepID=UPI00339E5895